MPLPLGGGTVDDGLQDGPDHPDYICTYRLIAFPSERYRPI